MPQQAACGTGFESISFITGIERASTCAAYCAVSQPTWLLLRSVYQRDLKYPIVPNRHYSDSASINVTPVCSQNPVTQQSHTCIGCSLATFTDIRRMSLRLSCTLGRCLQSRTCSLLCFRSCLSWRKELTSAMILHGIFVFTCQTSSSSACFLRVMFVLLIVFFVTRIRCSSHLASSSYSLSRCIVSSHHCRLFFSTLASGFRSGSCGCSSVSFRRLLFAIVALLTDSGDLVSGIGTLSIVVQVARPRPFT